MSLMSLSEALEFANSSLVGVIVGFALALLPGLVKWR